MTHNLHSLFTKLIDMSPQEQGDTIQGVRTTDPALAEELELLLSYDAGDYKEEIFSIEHEAPAPVEVGQKLSEYKILAPIGKGTSGWVFKAKHLQLEKIVAIKILNSSLSTNPDLVLRFRQEAKIINAINHPSVVDVFDFIEISTPPCLGYVMPFLKGKTLRYYLSKQMLTENLRLGIAWQLLDGLEAVHKAGVVHRDLKPENIIVLDNEPLSSNTIPKALIIDFGLAKLRASSAAKTATGLIMGTPAYMAPEQVLGGDVSPATDLYTFGLLLFELLFGYRLLESESSTALFNSTESLPPKVKDIVGPYKTLLESLLSRDPKLRIDVHETKKTFREIWNFSAQENTYETIISFRWVGSSTPINYIIKRYAGAILSTEHDQHHLIFQSIKQAFFFLFDMYSDIYPNIIGGIGVASHYSRNELRILSNILRNRSVTGQILISRQTAEFVKQHSNFWDTLSKNYTWSCQEFGQLESDYEYLEIFELKRLEIPSNRNASKPLASNSNHKDLLWRPRQQATIPTRPDWVLIRKVGEGGVGEVWTAENTKTKQLHAFKFVFSRSGKKALTQEVNIYNRIQALPESARSTPQLYHFNLAHPPYFIELEYIEGGDLRKWWSAYGGCSDLAREMVVRLANTIAETHLVGIIHKDLKPSNILIRSNGKHNPEIFLCDFGVGEIIDEVFHAETCNTSSIENTNNNTNPRLSGTVAYMAPERILGQKATIKADIYSIGVILFQLIVNDFSRVPIGAWRDDVLDPLLQQDISDMIDPLEDERISEAKEITVRLRTLEERRQAQEAERTRKLAIQRGRRFRRVAVPTLVSLGIVTGILLVQNHRISAEAERANHAAATSKRVVNLMIDIFGSSEPQQKPPSVRELLARSAQRLNHELTSEPKIRVRMLDSISTVYRNIGMYEEAERLSILALSLSEQIAKGMSHEIANSNFALGAVELHLFKHEQAKAHLEAALSIWRHQDGHSTPKAIAVLPLLGKISFHQGNLTIASKYYNEALKIIDDTKNSNNLRRDCIALTQISWYFSATGQHKLAEHLLSRALQLLTSGINQPTYLRADIEYHLGNVLINLGRFGEAQINLEQVHVTMKALLDPNHPKVGRSMLSLGRLYRYQKDFSKALEFAHKGVNQLQSSLGKKHLDVARGFLELGMNYGAKGDHASEIDAYKQAVDLFRKLPRPPPTDTARALNNLGAALSDYMGQHVEAEEYLRESVAMFDQALSPLPKSHLYALWSLANNLRDQGRQDEAMVIYKRALIFFENGYSKSQLN